MSNLTRPLLLQWSRRFEGTPDQLAIMRRWLRELLPSCPAREDLLTIGGELAANAVTHTRSGLPGGTFSAHISWSPEIIRLVIGDQGAPKRPVVVTDSNGTGGLGLSLVSKVAQRWGVVGTENGRRVWADIAWNHGGDPIPAALEVLRHQYPEAHAWYGSDTATWWAALPWAGLISAQSPSLLGGQLAEKYAHRKAACASLWNPASTMNAARPGPRSPFPASHLPAVRSATPNGAAITGPPISPAGRRTP